MPKIVDHEKRRQFIAQKTFEALDDIPLENLTIAGIAKACSVSKGVVEHYFNNKDELLFAALNIANDTLRERQQQQLAGKDGIELLRARITSGLPLDKISRIELKVRLTLWKNALYDNEVYQQQKKLLQAARNYFEKDIRSAQQAGDIDINRDSGQLARHVLYFITGMGPAVMRDREYYSKKVIQAEVDAFITELMS